MRIRSKQRTKHSQTTPTEPRVFVGLFEIAGYYGRIVDHLREAGYPISFIEVTAHRFGYKSEMPRSDYKYESFLKSTAQSRKSLFSQIKFRIVGIHLFFWAVKNHDVFVFVAGNSFSKKNLDLYLLRVLRKRIVSFVAHGSEARPAFMDGAHWSIAQDTDDPIREIFITFQRQKRTLHRIEQHSDLVIAHPLTSQLLRNPSVASMYIGLPGPERFDLPIPKPTLGGTGIRILHVPSDRRAKGSDKIGEIIQRIRIDTTGVIYQELSGVTNSEVLARIAQSDIVIDQLYSDTQLAGVGVEAASIGVAVLVGSYGASEMVQVIEQNALPPALVVHPKDFEWELRHLIDNTQFRSATAQRCQLFVCNQWNIENVSLRFLSAVNGTFPSNWYFNPMDISYLYGSGHEETDLKAIWKLGFERYGDKFFNIMHRPDLLQRIQSLI
jgi:hypothetical protein